MKIKLVRNKQGSLQITHPTNLGLFADFLETDVNENLDYCQEILATLAHIEKASDPSLQKYFCGNLYELEIGVSEAILLNLHDDSVAPAHIQLDELAELLIAWQQEIAVSDS